MSETPRTDAAEGIEIYDANGCAYVSELVDADFARRLERELNAAKKQLIAQDWNKATIEHLEKRVAELNQDRRRLDWVISTAGLGALWDRWEYSEPMHRNDPMTREELDAAMKTDLP